MKRLVNIENPSIIITAPDKLINEVGGNCYQIGGSQPLTYAKNLWRLEEINILKGIDEVAEELANEHGFIKHPSFKPAKYSYQAVRDVFIEAAKAGAEWMAGQGVSIQVTEDEKYQQGVHDGKEEALNDLPRWKKLPNGIMKQVNLFGRAIIVNNHYILYSDLEKLPGFKED